MASAARRGTDRLPLSALRGAAASVAAARGRWVTPLSLVLVVTAAACQGTTEQAGGTPAPTPPPTPTGALVSIVPSQPKQTIDGFGGSNAWTVLPSDAGARAKVVELLFSSTKGAGLSILRNRIPFRERSGADDAFLAKDGRGAYVYTVAASGSKTFTLNWSTWDLAGTRALLSAVAAAGSDYDVPAVFSTPWTPPNNAVDLWKAGVPDLSQPQIGGHLDPAHYRDYADALADYALGFEARMGRPLAAVSIQNEPNWSPQYESCSWTRDQFTAFLPVLRAEFAAKGVPSTVKVIAPEDMNFKEDLVSDDALARIDVVGVHQYEWANSGVANDGAEPLTRTAAAGKRIWMTEWSTEGTGDDASIADGLVVARVIHEDLALAQVNAFLYWWLWRNDASTLSSGALLAVNGATVLDSKRLYVLGQYSRFVRPGWVRVAATPSPAQDVRVTAFVSPDATRIAVVASNAGSSDVKLSLLLPGSPRFGALSAYRTSATESLASLGTSPVGSALAEVTAAARSVTTWTGDLAP